MKNINRPVQFAFVSVFLISASILSAAPWAIVTDTQSNRISVVDFSAASPTVYGPFLYGQLGTNYGSQLLDVDVTPDGKKALMSNFSDSTVYMVDTSIPTNPVVLGCVSNGFFAEDISIAPNGQFAIVTDGGFSTRMAIIDLSNLTTSITYTITSGCAQAVSVAPDNQTVIMADYSGRRLIYGVLGPTGLVSESVLTCRSYPDTNNFYSPVNVAISPDGRTVLTANAGTNEVNVFRIVSPGVVVTGETPVVTGIAPFNGMQSIVFSPLGDRAYVLCNGVDFSVDTNGVSTNVLSWLQINGPGNVTLGEADVAPFASITSSQLFGVDTMDVSPDGAWLLESNPNTSGGTNFLSLINLSTFATSSFDSLMEIPEGIAFVRTPAFSANLSLAQTGRAPVVGETLTYLITVTNNGYAVLNPVRLDLGYNTNHLSYISGNPAAADNVAGGVATWTNVGALAVGGQVVVTAQFTAASSTLPGATTNSLVTTASTWGGFPLDPQTSSVPAIIPLSPLAADFDGDAKADPAMYDAAAGTWKVKLSTAGYTLITVSDLLGGRACVPLAADFDGDRLADPTIYRAALALWLVKLSSIGYLAPTALTSFGGSELKALAADFDGDRIADPALYHDASGTWAVKLSTADYYTFTRVGLLGWAGWTAIAADFDGDGKADPAVYKPSTGSWVVLLSKDDYAVALLEPGFLGGWGYIGMAADFDGDGLADPAVCDPLTGHWKVKLSGANYTLVDLPNFI